MTYPLVQFVAAPEPEAEVLFDFNDHYGLWGGAVTEVEAEGWSIGVPQIEGASDSVGVEWGDRSLTFTLRVRGSRYAALQVQSLLARQILRVRNWLMFQLDPMSAPVWFHTYNSQPGELSFDQVYLERAEDTWRIGVKLDAEPFAYGQRVSLGPFTINNNPAAAANPCCCVLPEILGDAPAPLRIAAAFSVARHQSDILWAASPVPANYQPVVWQIGDGDGWTADVDTAAAAASSAFSGGSYREVSFATTAGLARRLYGTAPAAIPRGRYRVFLRVARSDTASTFAFRLGRYNSITGTDYTGAETVRMDRSASTTAGHATYVDLGVRSFPRFMNTLPGVKGYNPRPGISLQVERLSGTGAAQLDAFVLVPVKLESEEAPSRMMTSEFATYGPFVDDVASYWDGDLESYTRMNGFAVLESSIQPINHGAPPVVHPGVTNAVHLLQQTRLTSGTLGATDNSDDIAATATVTFSYHPRLMYLAGY